MVGVPQFSQSEVLARALDVFWSKGYEQTSIPELERATGLGRGSLYNAFGDKEGLFLAVLDHYAETVGDDTMAPLSNPDPKKAIRGMLEVIAQRMNARAHPPGCLNTNTCIECPGAPEAVKRKIVGRFADMETGLYQLLQAAQRRGKLSSSADPRALARYFIAVTQGLAVLNKINPDPSVLDDVVDVAMSAWPKGKR